MAKIVNQTTKKRLTLKRLAKRKKHIGTGDGGLLTDKTRTTFR